MIVDRYPPRRLFRLVPDLPQAFAPELAQLDRLLEDDAIFSRVKADMARRRPHSLTLGRPGTPVEVVLRLLVLKRLHGWSDEEVERFVGDSPSGALGTRCSAGGSATMPPMVLRPFCRVYLKKVPDDTTLRRWAQVIAPASLAALNERVVALARQLAVTRGRKLRLDSTVVATTIHHPSDSSLLADGVRVLSRVLRRARAVLGPAASLSKARFRTRLRRARRLVQSLHRLGRRKGEAATEAMRQADARLIAVARKTQAQAIRVGTALHERPEPPAQRLARQLDTYLPRVARAITQAVRRVLQGETVPAGEKIVSLFEPRSQIIVRHKAGKPVEFGRKLWLEEVEGGIVSGWRLLDQPGQDASHLLPSLAAHQARFGRPPWLVAGDRGVFSAENERRARAAGVERVVLPAVGKVAPERSCLEKQRWFRRGFRFRAGIEGRISVLQRCHGLDRCRDHGEDGMGRWIGWGIVAGNLERIARTVAARQQASVA
jgi:transposase, IS5 family